MGIVGKIWSIGSSGGSVKNISSSVDYITNEEKCDYTLKNTMKNVIGYVSNDVKTVKGAYIGYKYILDEKSIPNEMMAIKAFYGKDTGRNALHGIISLDADESDINNAGKLMMLCSEFLQEVYPNHQAIYAVHTDTDNLHVHFVVNTVGLDGKKIHMDKGFMRNVFQVNLNKLALKYGFSPNESFGEKERDVKTLKDRKIYLRDVIDRGIEISDNFTELVNYLRKRDISVNVGKHMSLKAKGMNKAMRTYQLGTLYSIDAIKNRILEKREPFDEFNVSKNKVEVVEPGISTYISKSLKKYKDMTDEDKREAVKLLRLGRNPWKEMQTNNWMIERLDDELRDQSKCIALLNNYSPNTLNPNTAMQEIINRQKDLQGEIKELNKIKRKYRVQFNLYEEAKQLESKAYLYESKGYEKYLKDYSAYILIRSRLRDNYSKEIEEIGSYKEELEGNILYLKAQLKELKAQYKIIYNYVNPKDTLSLFDAIGHSKAREEAYYKGVYATKDEYISDKNSDYIIHVIQRPGTKKGKNTIITEMTVLDRDNRVIEELSSKEMEERAFSKEINRISKEYSLKECRAYQSRAAVLRQ